MARSGGQFRANSAVMQRSSNRPASEPPPVFIEGSGCCERAPRPGPLMLVDGLKIGARDHARAVIRVSAISVVAGARNHRNRLASPSWWRSSDRRTCPILSRKPPTRSNRWEFSGNQRENLVGKWESDRISPKPAPGPGWPHGDLRASAACSNSCFVTITFSPLFLSDSRPRAPSNCDETRTCTTYAD